MPWMTYGQWWNPFSEESILTAKGRATAATAATAAAQRKTLEIAEPTISAAEKRLRETAKAEITAGGKIVEAKVREEGARSKRQLFDVVALPLLLGAGGWWWLQR